MDPLQLWAGVRFAAQNGNTGGLLTAAAQNGLHLSAITAQPGGFCARCAAWRYPELSRLARRYRVRLRVQKRDGLFFRLRPLLRRRGLWAGLFLFLPLLLWLQGAVWATDFTTLTPVLGVVRVGPEQSFVCADIPGLIEGAAEGVGLGHDFLRHVERCRLLLHVVDVSGCEGRDPKADFEQINHELAGFSAELADRPQIVLGNKCDIASPEQVEEFKQYVEAKGLTFLPISAATRQGVDNLPALVYNRLKDLPPVKVYEAEYKRPDKNAQPTRPFTVERTGDHEFTVDAPWLERILAGTNVEDYESLQYFQTQLGDSGILDELVAQGVEEEDTIKIGEYEFDYLY